MVSDACTVDEWAGRDTKVKHCAPVFLERCSRVPAYSGTPKKSQKRPVIRMDLILEKSLLDVRHYRYFISSEPEQNLYNTRQQVGANVKAVLEGCFIPTTRATVLDNSDFV